MGGRCNRDMKIIFHLDTGQRTCSNRDHIWSSLDAKSVDQRLAEALNRTHISFSGPLKFHIFGDAFVYFCDEFCEVSDTSPC